MADDDASQSKSADGKADDDGGSGSGSDDGSESSYNSVLAKLTPAELQEFRELFDLVDLDKGGSIEPDELAALMETLGLQTDKDELDAAIREIDEDGSGEIEFDEFVQMMSKKVEPEYTPQEVIDAFKVFEAAHLPPGNVESKVLRRALVTYGVKDLPEEEVLKTQNFVMTQLDQKGFGKLNYVDYIFRVDPRAKEMIPHLDPVAALQKQIARKKTVRTPGEGDGEFDDDDDDDDNLDFRLGPSSGQGNTPVNISSAVGTPPRTAGSGVDGAGSGASSGLGDASRGTSRGSQL